MTDKMTQEQRRDLIERAMRVHGMGSLKPQPQPNDGPRYFVYVFGNKGPQPQLWYGDQCLHGTDRFKYKPVGAEGSDLLYFRKLEGDDFELSLDRLIEKYPFKEGFVYTGSE